MSKEHDAPALAKREPSISDADRDAISTAARAELRDRFAMAALTGLLAKGTVSHLHYEECQYHADGIADAMLKARGQ